MSERSTTSHDANQPCPFLVAMAQDEKFVRKFWKRANKDGRNTETGVQKVSCP